MISIRAIASGDIGAILSLERARIGDSLGLVELEQAVKGAGYLCWVATADERLVGYILCSLTSGEAELYSIAVAPDHEGRGIGRALMDEAFKELKAHGAQKILLEVEVGNERAYRLYLRQGFKEYRRRKGYYGGVDAICMEREI
ncbi:MAG TPA: ribosomal-protein-alanine N-acetyltransferase [Firmicutes bacterium]|nr:ribosomal-protein-alanine N-acetyltransferase [Bacillota bacterium]